MKNILTLSIFSLMSLSAFADQCSVLKISSANIAKEILSTHLSSNKIAVIDKFCESCMDKRAMPIVIDSIETKDFQVKGYKEIYINKQKIDLAYIYINGKNIATSIGCRTIGVSEYL
jgi:hypothetical protein